jgi:hypothetical protein
VAVESATASTGGTASVAAETDFFHGDAVQAAANSSARSQASEH